MSGHSKWASIKHKKGATDAKRGKLFSKLNAAILVAARTGGADPDKNIELRNAIQKAKEANMPKDNIERAIKKGTGTLDGVSLENITFEGYAPSGVALLIEVVTDNHKRSTADIRHILSKNGGNLGASGCVAWMFERWGVVYVAAEGVSEDSLLEVVLDAGAEDLSQNEGNFEIKCSPEALEAVTKAVRDGGYQVASSEVTMLPKTEVKVSADIAKKVLRLMDQLDDHDDVQAVHSNFDIPDEVMAELGGN